MGRGRHDSKLTLLKVTGRYTQRLVFSGPRCSLCCRTSLNTSSCHGLFLRSNSGSYRSVLSCRCTGGVGKAFRSVTSGIDTNCLLTAGGFTSVFLSGGNIPVSGMRAYFRNCRDIRSRCRSHSPHVAYILRIPNHGCVCIDRRNITARYPIDFVNVYSAGAKCHI